MAGHLERVIHVGLDLRDFSSWMASEQRRVFLLCRRMLLNEDEADSATQDVFLKAYRALSSKPELEDLDNPGRWVTRIAVNTCLDRLRSRSWKVWQRRPAVLDEELMLQMLPASAPDAERQAFSKQIGARLEQSLAKLSHRQRAIFSLRHYDGLPLEEIAQTLGLDVGTVKAHLFRGVTKLRDELRDLYSTSGKS
jgi:RNA polymerase sigma-70 factor (ECF subfamily)